MSDGTHDDYDKCSIFQINIQGLANKCSVLETFLLKSKYKFLAVCISEHWLTGDQMGGLCVDGYCLGTYFARTVYRRGGTAILVRADVAFVPIDFDGVSVEKDGEIVGVRLTNQKLIILSIYRSPSGNLDNFLNIISVALSKITIQDYNVMLMGDFNVHFNNKNEVAARSVCDFLTEYGLSSNFVDPTRLGSCIDNAFSNIAPAPDFEVINFPFSDHMGIATHFKSKVNIDNVKFLEIRPTTANGLNEFFNLVDSTDFERVYDDTVHVGVRVNYFINTLTGFAATAFPLKKLRVNNSDELKLSWFTPELGQMRTCLHDMNQEYHATGDSYIKSLRDSYRRQYRSALIQAKRDASDRYIQDHKRSSRSIWRVITKNKNESMIEDGSVLTADDFNNFFLSAPIRLTAHIPPTQGPFTTVPLIPTVNAQFKFSALSQMEVSSAIDAMKLGKSFDYFGLNVMMIKYIKKLIVAPLTEIFNSCIREGHFPDILKVAKVTPIHKKGEVNDPSNYRPISILPAISKVFELLLKNQLVEFLENNNILNDNQHGFRAGRSTSSAISAFVDRVVGCFERGEYCSVMFLDLSKAFDCVSHELLVRKLYMYNVLPNSVKLITSYLSNRYQCVNYNKEESALGSLMSGVPQGSILGPVLFLLYINDFSNALAAGDSLLYADDTTIFSGGSSMTDAMTAGADKMGIARQWFNANGLLLNETKTENLVLTLRHSDSDRQSIKFLGVHIDSQLTWCAHGDTLSAKLSSATFALRRLSESVSASVLRIAYFSIFQSHMTYGLLSWGHSAVLGRIFALQRRAVRVISGLGYRDDCRDAFIRLRVLTLPSLYIYECVKYVLYRRNELTTQSDVHSYSTRRNNDIRYVRLRLSRSQNGVNYFGYKFYNAIDMRYRSWRVEPLLNHLKSHLMRNAFYSVDDFFTNPLQMSAVATV